MGVLRKIIIILLNGYKKIISPYLPMACRFYPTCSSYAIEAFTKYSFLKASFLTLKRILRCNPFCKGGIDPLP